MVVKFKGSGFQIKLPTLGFEIEGAYSITEVGMLKFLVKFLFHKNVESLDTF